MDKKQIRYIRLDDHEDTVVQEVAARHGTSLAAAIRFIIRDWKRIREQIGPPKPRTDDSPAYIITQ